MGLLLVGLLGLLIAAPLLSKEEDKHDHYDHPSRRDWIDDMKRDDPGKWRVMKDESENRYK